MNVKTYDSIIIEVYFHEEGRFWNIVAKGFMNDGSNPEEIETNPNWINDTYSEAEVLKTVTSMAEWFTNEQAEERSDVVSIELENSEGNESHIEVTPTKGT